MKLNELFKLSRILEGVSQVDLASAVEISQPAIQRFESGQPTLSVATIRKIAPFLKINPEYVIDETKNPFKSDELIKMFFNEKMSLYIIEPINVLVFFNNKLKFISLVSNINLPSKVSGLSLSPNPIYAIAVEDENNNIFLLRRIIKTNFIKLDGPLYMDIWPLVVMSGSKKKLRSMYFASQKIDRDLHQKITDWTVKREDIAPLFSRCTFRALLPEIKEV